MSKFYVTSPIYYVNAKPHLGTLYSTLLCDALARWHKVLGDDVFFLTGTDEHGQKIQEKAALEGKEPQGFVDAAIPAFKQAWQLFNLSYDKFIRTTDVDHKQAVVEWITTLMNQGDIYKSVYTGWYCVPCETFINVGTEGIKNEQQQYICTSCSRPLKELEEESYFFKLSAYQDRLLEFYANNPGFITPKERFNEVIAFVKAGLKDLSISRKTVSWGIPFPGDSSHTVYVWGDALNNYISAIGYGDSARSKEFAHWWPADVHVMAKDIVRFHAVYWPAFLMAAHLPLPKKLLVHGYILTGSQKMSKSLGNAIDPIQLAQTYGVDQVRYYLLKQMAVNQDGNFSIQELEDIVNADLSNNLGNLLSRTIALAYKYDYTKVPSGNFDQQALVLHEKAEYLVQSYKEHLDQGMFHIALAEVCKYLSEVNAYFHATQPWVVAKTDSQAFVSILSTACHALHVVANLLWPIMPTKMNELLKALGMHEIVESNDAAILNKALQWNIEFQLHELVVPLFVRFEKTIIEEKKESLDKEKVMSNHCTIEDFAKLELLAGTIVTCEAVAGSSKLLRLEVDFGLHGKRQILSGIAQSFKPEELIGKQGVFLANLPPRAMMGMESQGMLLCAKDEQGLAITTVSRVVANGTKLT